MNSLTPSFYTIYRQGRFLRRQPPNGTKAIEQRERFSVACLAFVLEHDQAFRAEFLKYICGWNAVGNSEEFSVIVELDNCGDLALESERLGQVFILECKIEASLKPKQHPHPNSDVFFLSGYGAGILKRYKDFPKPTYITLQQDDGGITYPPSDKLICLSKRWCDLLDCPATRKQSQSLVTDLLSSLAELRVRCFANFNMQTQKMKLIDDALKACQVESLLDNTSAAIKQLIRLAPAVENATELGTIDDTYIGRGQICKNAPPKWISFIAANDFTNETDLSWFGYQHGKRQVGLYCARQKMKRVETALKESAGDLGTIRSDDGYVWIESDGSQLDGDQEWFVEIYKRLAHRIER